jgi:hypothetical protein
MRSHCLDSIDTSDAGARHHHPDIT